MTVIPELSYRRIIAAFRKADFVFVSQKGSHIKLERRSKQKKIKIIIPAHTPVKRSTLAKIIKVSGLSVEEFNNLI
jgi:predicted RNA binding protein YcfA (HicA-like mRNA interferase family)